MNRCEMFHIYNTDGICIECGHEYVEEIFPPVSDVNIRVNGKTEEQLFEMAKLEELKQVNRNLSEIIGLLEELIYED